MTEKNYPVILDRVKAALIDTTFLIGEIILASYIFSLFDNVPDLARIIIVIFIFLLYDPLFTSLFGGTIGHMIMNIRVKRSQNEERNIIFPLAIIRFIVKVLLGSISLLTLIGYNKKKAIHDIVAGSVVIFRSQEA